MDSLFARVFDSFVVILTINMISDDSKNKTYGYSKATFTDA